MTTTPPVYYSNYNDALAAASDKLAQLQADFQAKYKYTILGQEDSLFFDVGGAATGGDDNFNAIKNFRTNELLAIDRINASSDSDDSKLRQGAVAKLTFVSNAIPRINNVISKTALGSHDSADIATSLGALADHLLEAANDYATAVSDGLTDAKRDAGFIAAAKTARFGILQASLRIQPLLISDKVLFNTANYSLNGKLNSILTALDNIANGTAAAASSSSSSSSAVDITV
ncbi:MAG: hypothetical protein GC185_01655 [Alphaproteobacteria bacterium]|nr:hypothetical protein [Alphaproteobacteria bacterium]